MTSHQPAMHVSVVPAEARAYQGVRAGIVSRLASAVIDCAVTLGALAAGYLAAAAIRFMWRPRTFSFPTPSSIVIVVVGCVLIAAYLTLSWAGSGRTYGDQVLGLRVVNRNGRRLSIGSALVRAFAYMLVPIGLLWVAVNRENRSLQDIALRTSVIYDWEPHAGA